MPTREHVKQALKKATTKVAYDYFFKNLKSPDWISPLEEENVFQSPPQVSEINGTLIAPFWEPSKYLARMAALCPEKVLSAINKIPATNNPRIHEDFINAALLMPPEYATKLLKKVVKSLDNPYQLLIPSKVAELAVYFLKIHLTDEAIQLCKSLLDIQSSEKKYKSYKSRFVNDWEFNEKIKDIISHVEECETKKNFAKLLCNKLKKCMQFDVPDKETNEFRDYSCSWRQTVANQNNDMNLDTRDILINWIIVLYESLLNQNSKLINEIVPYLSNQRFPIFSRIALHLSEKYRNHQDIIMSLLLDNKLAKSTDTWHEYAVLLKNSYPDLSPGNKKLVLDFIYKIEFVSSNIDDHQEKNKRRRYRFLYLIREFLENSDKFKFDSMLTEYGEIDNSTFLIYMTGARAGFFSHIQPSDLNEKSIDEIIYYLNTWTPSTNVAKDPFGESIEGLANALQNSVVNRHIEYIAKLEKFRLKKCIYLRSIIYGLEKSATETNQFDWLSVLNFLNWATSDNNDLESANDDDIDAGISGIRDAACRLLEKSFALKSNELPSAHKELIWSIIQNCLFDSNPNIDREMRSENDKDYYQLAINSTRSIALECGIQYGLWVMRKSNISKELSNRNDYPELFNALDKHLNIKFEKSKAVHSIYGRWLPWLHLLDKNWTRENIQLIFPHDKDDSHFLRAAWSAYLLYSQPYDEIFDLIKFEYLNAIKEFDYPPKKSKQNETRLLDQIVIFYLRGKINLDDELITILFNKNNIEIVKHLVNFAGRVTPDDFKTRAIQLWEFVLAKCDKLANYSSLEEFGWWAHLNFIDDEWILDQLLIVLAKNKTINHVHSVMERLILSAKNCPVKVAQIFRIIVENRVREHGFFMWRDRARDLIPILLETDAKEETIIIIQKLGALGFYGIRSISRLRKWLIAYVLIEGWYM